MPMEALALWWELRSALGTQLAPAEMVRLSTVEDI